MKHTLMIAALVFSASLVALSQAQGGRSDQDAKPDGRRVLPSPMMSFRDEPGLQLPLRMLYVGTYAVPDSSRAVEVELEPRNGGGQAVRNYTVYCEEELATPAEGDDVVKKLHRFDSKVLQPISFRVQKDSRLTFWVASAQFADGTIWAHSR
jgi:hypothetical protein